MYTDNIDIFSFPSIFSYNILCDDDDICVLIIVSSPLFVFRPSSYRTQVPVAFHLRRFYANET